MADAESLQGRYRTSARADGQHVCQSTEDSSAQGTRKVRGRQNPTHGSLEQLHGTQQDGGALPMLPALQRKALIKQRCPSPSMGRGETSLPKPAVQVAGANVHGFGEDNHKDSNPTDGSRKSTRRQ